MRDIASRICRDYLTGAWKTIHSSDIQIKRIRYCESESNISDFFRIKKLQITLSFSVVACRISYIT